MFTTYQVFDDNGIIVLIIKIHNQLLRWNIPIISSLLEGDILNLETNSSYVVRSNPSWYSMVSCLSIELLKREFLLMRTLFHNEDTAPSKLQFDPQQSSRFRSTNSREMFAILGNDGCCSITVITAVLAVVVMFVLNGWRKSKNKSIVSDAIHPIIYHTALIFIIRQVKLRNY